MDNLYNRIETLCNKKGITITQMCKESGASRGSLTDLSKGRIHTLSSATLNKISAYFNVPVDSLANDVLELNYIPPREIEEAIITCPVCGYDYVHYIRTLGVNFDNEKSSGFAIEYRCEGEHTFYWVVESYKGNTYVVVIDERDDIDVLKSFRVEDGIVNLGEELGNNNTSNCSIDSFENEYGIPNSCVLTLSQLNSDGQKKVLEYIQDLSSMEKYLK